MKKILLILIVLGLMLSNCTKENKESEIVIEYEMLDDVSPVKTILTVNNELHWSEWILDGSIPQQPEDNNYSRYEYVFNDTGLSNVKINASGINGEKYFGNLDIEIPQIADKLIIYGYSFDNEYDFGITDENLIFRFSYYNGSEYSNYTTTISTSTFENNDSITFESPLIIDISGFEIIEWDNINFIIEGAESHNFYFRTNFFLKDWYYHHRMYSPSCIYLDNIIGDNYVRIYITSDWTR